MSENMMMGVSYEAAKLRECHLAIREAIGMIEMDSPNFSNNERKAWTLLLDILEKQN